MTQVVERRAKAPKMTPEQAKRFERGVSLQSYAQVVEQVECGCEPYVDVFTYRRWQAQGFQVRKGEKAKKFASWVPVGETAEDEPDNGKRKGLIARTLSVFCRCQVDPKE